MAEHFNTQSSDTSTSAKHFLATNACVVVAGR